MCWIGGWTMASVLGRPAQAASSSIEWRVGNVSIRRLWERDVVPLDPTRFFPDATPSTMAAIPWLHPWFTDDRGQITLSIAAFLIESRGRRTLVDTGIGDFVIDGFPLLPRPGAAVPGLVAALEGGAATIDDVVNTHLHADHVGGNVGGSGAGASPSFPRARYIVGQDEYDYWSSQPPDSFGRHVFETAVRPIVTARRLQLATGHTRLTDEVSIVPTPGHTPGHLSVEIVSRGHAAMITGDMLHHPVQLAFPDRGMDQDEGTAAATRRSLLSWTVKRKALLIGSHFPAPGAGRIEQEGSAFRLLV